MTTIPSRPIRAKNDSRQHGVALLSNPGEVFGPRFHRLGKAGGRDDRRFIPTPIDRLLCIAPPSSIGALFEAKSAACQIT
jgi:hypothetical protein